jgi:hypothetical protein
MFGTSLSLPQLLPCVKRTTPLPLITRTRCFVFVGAERHHHSGHESSLRGRLPIRDNLDPTISYLPSQIVILQSHLPIFLSCLPLSLNIITKEEEEQDYRKHDKNTRNPVCNHATLGRPPLSLLPRLV